MVTATEPISGNSPEYIYKHTITQKARGSEVPQKMEKSYMKIVVILIIGIIIIIFGVTTGALWPSIYDWAILKVLTLTPTSMSYSLWQETPVPMYLKFHMFNWTNPHDFNAMSNIKPNFVEMGPYVFREIDYKVNMVWNDNGTVTFQRKKVWFFEESLSNGSLTDKITFLNPIATTLASVVKHKSRLVRELTNSFMKSLGEKLTLTKSVNALLFEGYNDTLLKIAKRLNITNLPYSKFGWFYARNESETYDGTFNILTGASNIYDLGMLKEWNFSNQTMYKDSCGEVKGSNGELWPPFLNNSTLSVFVNDICTYLTLNYDNETRFQGIRGNKYIGDESMLDNGKNVPLRQCYCPNGDCGPSGTLNISSCKFGAPAFISFPHFYLADPSYKDAITGMKPNKEEHELYIVLEPTIGIPLRVKVNLQLNLLIEPVKYMTMFENIKKTYFPILWFTQEANLTSNYANPVKVVLILPTLGVVTFFGLAGIGILVFFIGIFIFVRQKWKGEEDQVLLPKQENDVTNTTETW